MKLTPILIAAAALMIPLPATAQERVKKPAPEQSAYKGQQWEYKLVRVTYRGGNDREIEALNKALNEHGAQGWELVNTVKSDTNDQLLAVFKRAK